MKCVSATSRKSSRMECTRIYEKINGLDRMFVIYRQNNLPADKQGIKILLDRCFPDPPKDVYERLLMYYHKGDPFYTLEYSNQIVGMVYFARHTKGGNLESLALDPEFRGYRLSKGLIQSLMKDNTGIITLTTRIPDFFKKEGFQICTQLQDGSYFMFQENPLYAHRQ